MAKRGRKPIPKDIKIDIAIFVVGMIILFGGIFVWWRFIYTSPSRTFWTMVDQSLQARGVTRTIEQVQEGGKMQQIACRWIVLSAIGWWLLSIDMGYAAAVTAGADTTSHLPEPYPSSQSKSMHKRESEWINLPETNLPHLTGILLVSLLSAKSVTTLRQAVYRHPNHRCLNR